MRTLLLALFCCASSTFAAGPNTAHLDHWQTLGRMYALLDVEHAFGRYWIAAHGLYSSENAKTWRAHSRYARSMAFDGTNLVVAGDGTVARTSNGRDWSEAPLSRGFGGLNYIVYGKGVFVGSDQIGILASRDGLRWSRVLTNRTVRGYIDLAFGDGRFAAGQGFATSEDGLRWTVGTNRVVAGDGGVVYGNGKFVAARGQTIVVFTNALQQTVITNENWRLWDVLFDGSRFVAVGRGPAVASSDGLNWEPIQDWDGDYLAFAQHTAGRYFFQPELMGSSASSSDGANWNLIQPAAFGVQTFAYGNGVFAGTGEQDPEYGQGTFTVKSNDGVNWTYRDSPATNTLLSSVFAEGRFIGVGNYARVAASSDGLEWADLPTEGLDPLVRLFCVAHSPLGYFAGGSLTNAGQLYRSTNALRWEKTLELALNPIRAVAFGVGKAVAVASYIDRPGYIATSSDGIRWNTQPVPALLAHVTHANGLFVAVGNSGAVGVSANGDDWQIRSITSNRLSRVAFGGGRFVAVGEGTRIWSSADGREWTPHLLAEPVAFRTLAYGQRSFVAGGNESIFRSSHIAPELRIDRLMDRARLRQSDPLSAPLILEQSLDLLRWEIVQENAPDEILQPLAAPRLFFRVRSPGD